MAPSATITEKPGCVFGIRADQRIGTLETSDKGQWKAIDELRNRLPAYATVLISALTFLLGATLTYAALAVQIAALKK